MSSSCTPDFRRNSALEGGDQGSLTPRPHMAGPSSHVVLDIHGWVKDAFAQLRNEKQTPPAFPL